MADRRAKQLLLHSSVRCPYDGARLSFLQLQGIRLVRNGKMPAQCPLCLRRFDVETQPEGKNAVGTVA